jgi:putative flippase GtrA
MICLPAMSDAEMGENGRLLRRVVTHVNPKQFVRFALVGAIATLVQLAILVTLVELAHVGKPYANAIGYVGGAGANYLLNRRITFSGTTSGITASALKFAVTSLLGLGLNSLIFVSLIAVGLYYLVAWVVAVGLTLIWNYTAARLIVFRDR